MIRPEEIRRRAERVYRDYVAAVVEGRGDFFPYRLRANLSPGHDVAEAARSIHGLREASKETIGYGFTIEWTERRSKRLGRNMFPTGILFTTEDDLLRYLGRTGEFGRLMGALQAVRAELPELERWFRRNVNALPSLEPDLFGLLEVTKYLRDNPRPGVFARELPLSVDTKFVERHEGVLRRWLDEVLPPEAIRADEGHFARRYGLRYVEPQLDVRCLDAAVQAEMLLPCDFLSVPLSTIAEWTPPASLVVVVENRVNLLTFPRVAGAVALGGLGKAAALLPQLPWLQDRRLVYWGDLDAEGLEILSGLRAALPQTESLFMDADTLILFRDLAGAGSGAATRRHLAHLGEEEMAAYALCVAENLRLEQERIPQREVVRRVAEHLACRPCDGAELLL